MVRHAKATHVDVKMSVIKDKLFVTVRDNGIGMNLEDVLTGKDHRSGLGLSTMEERARLMEGAIHITSAVNRGTIIDIVLPIWGRKK